jgi:hypothetical protein
MANPIIKILRGATPPSPLLAGQFAVDQVAKNLYLGVEVGGVVTNEIVGGEGTFATKSYVTTAVTNATGSLGTMSTQNANAVAITGGAIDGTVIGATTPSTGAFTTLSATELSGAIDATNAVINFSSLNDAILEGAIIRNASSVDDSPIGATTPSTGAFTTLTASSAPSASNDVVRKTDLDTAVSALGSVFHYVGDVSAYTDASNPFELANIVDQSTGAYYRVDVAGTYTAGVGPSMEAKVGDAFVKTTTGWQKLDNVDAVVSGTANEISVTGDENAGYTVAIDPVFSGRVDITEENIVDLQTKTQNIDLAGTTAGNTRFKGKLTVDQVADPYAAPEFVVKDLYGGEVVNINGDSSSIVFGDDMNPNTKVTVHKAFEVITNGSIPDISVSSGAPVKINESANSQTWNGYGTLDIQAGGGLMTAGGEEIGVQTNGALVCNNATPMPIEGFVIDGGVY